MRKYLHKGVEKLRQHKLLLHNFGYLSAVQAMTLLVPIITFPYLIVVLGTETYGLVVFARAIVMYFTIIVNFGLGVSAVKEISKHRDNQEKISEIVFSVFLIKGTLTIFSFLALWGVLQILPVSDEHHILFFLTMHLCLYEWLNCLWYFHGIEKMKYVSLINVISKVVFVVLLFVLVKHQSDYLLIPIVEGIGNVVAILVSLAIMVRKVNFKVVSINRVFAYAKDSAPFFLSNFLRLVKDRTNTVIIGSVFGMVEVAYYDVAYKITEVLKIPNQIMDQTAYPRIALHKSKQFIKNLFKVKVAYNVALTVMVFVFAAKILSLFPSEIELISATPLLQLFSITIPIVALSMFQFILFAAFDLPQIAVRGTLISAIFYLFLVAVLYAFGMIDMYKLVIITIIVEVVVVAYQSYYTFLKYKLIS